MHHVLPHHAAQWTAEGSVALASTTVARMHRVSPQSAVKAVIDP
jgi:hypothetical protein